MIYRTPETKLVLGSSGTVEKINQSHFVYSIFKKHLKRVIPDFELEIIISKKNFG